MDRILDIGVRDDPRKDRILDIGETETPLERIFLFAIDEFSVPATAAVELVAPTTRGTWERRGMTDGTVDAPC